MFRTLSFFLTVALFAWLMPLGAFIKPSQEKTACGGGRAFHMCSMMQGQAIKKHAPEKISFMPAPSGIEKHSQSQGSGGDEFLAAAAKFQHQLKFSAVLEDEFVLPQTRFIFPLERPPQAIF